MTASYLTPERLREVLHYDPLTGVFRWKVTCGQRALQGNKAGSIEHGYVKIKINSKPYKAHRLAWLYMTNEWPKNDIDHIDRNRNNNCFNNLRSVSRSINLQNQYKAQKNSSTNLRGVSFHKKNNKYVSNIILNKKHIYLGSFNTPEEAHAAYLKAKRKLHEGCML